MKREGLQHMCANGSTHCGERLSYEATLGLLLEHKARVCKCKTLGVSHNAKGEMLQNLMSYGPQNKQCGHKCGHGIIPKLSVLMRDPTKDTNLNMQNLPYHQQPCYHLGR